MVSWMGRGEGTSFYSNCACMCLIKGCGFGGGGFLQKGYPYAFNIHFCDHMDWVFLFQYSDAF